LLEVFIQSLNEILCPPFADVKCHISIPCQPSPVSSLLTLQIVTEELDMANVSSDFLVHSFLTACRVFAIASSSVDEDLDRNTKDSPG